MNNLQSIPYNYVCIEGNIGSGKTTFCEMMAEKYPISLVLEEFDDNPFLPLFYKNQSKWAFTVELFFMTERYKQLGETISRRNMFDDFILGDYFFTKTLLFARKNLSDEEFKMFHKIFQVLNSNFPPPELVIYFHRDVNYLRKNIEKRGRPYEEGITKEYLTTIQNSYFEYFRNVLSYPVIILDLKDIDFENKPIYFEFIESLMQKEYHPGVHRMSLNV